MDYLVSHYDTVLEYLLEHIELTLLALGLSFIIAFPMGVLASKVKVLSAPLNEIFVENNPGVF